MKFVKNYQHVKTTRTAVVLTHLSLLIRFVVPVEGKVATIVETLKKISAAFGKIFGKRQVWTAESFFHNVC